MCIHIRMHTNVYVDSVFIILCVCRRMHICIHAHIGVSIYRMHTCILKLSNAYICRCMYTRKYKRCISNTLRVSAPARFQGCRLRQWYSGFWFATWGQLSATIDTFCSKGAILTTLFESLKLWLGRLFLFW